MTRDTSSIVPASPSRPPSGRTIVLELLQEMEARLYPLLYRTLPPGAYHVYLHPDDYREIESIVPLIVADAAQGLSARVDELNGRHRWSNLLSSKQAPIEVPPAGWEIHIHPEPNGELARGELGIESRLAVPPPPRFEGGTPTTRIARTVVTGTIRRGVPAAPAHSGSSWTGTPNGALPPAAPAAIVSPGEQAPTPARPDGHASNLSTATNTDWPAGAATATGPTARLAYVDESGAHVFVMHKELISIGRGGSAHWVDVQVVSSARVSREHCRIRRTADGRFVLQDVSAWGTSVDGQPVTPFARQVDGHIEQTGHEHELSGRTRIQLADALSIDFTIER